MFFKYLAKMACCYKAALARDCLDRSRGVCQKFASTVYAVCAQICRRGRSCASFDNAVTLSFAYAGCRCHLGHIYSGCIVCADIVQDCLELYVAVGHPRGVVGGKERFGLGVNLNSEL